MLTRIGPRLQAAWGHIIEKAPPLRLFGSAAIR